METTAFFEKKINLTPMDMNELKKTPLDELLLSRAKNALENKCSEHGFVLPGSIQLLSRSMGYFEAARFTGDTVYYAKLQGKVIYPVDRIQVKGTIIRKNKMGLYVNFRDAIRIQVPRDLHLGNIEYDLLEVGDDVLIEMKRSKFAVNDPYILSSGLFISKVTDDEKDNVEDHKEEEEEEDKKDDSE
jgi:hypothetical protein